MKIIDELNQSIDIDNKSSHADRIYNGLSFTAAVLSCALLLAALIAYLVDPAKGLFVFAVVFYPTAVLIVVSYVFGIAELLRNRYFTTILAVVLTSAVLIGTVVFIILQGALLNNVAIFPFYKP